MSDSLAIYYGDLCLTDYPYSVEFDSLAQGAPQAVVEVLGSLLVDGDVEVSSRAGNRTLSLSVLVEGVDFDELAEHGEALSAEADKARNLLTIDPGDGFGATTVFETFRVSNLPVDRSEAMEGARLRRYLLTVKALPFGRSETETALTPTPTSISTARQRMHTVTNPGSARTETAIAVQHASTSLGEVLVYSFPDDGRGYSPPLRQYLTASGTTTVDAALVSGSRNMLDAQVTYTIPCDTLYEGQHLILARMRASGGTYSATLEINAQTRMGSTLLSGQNEFGVDVPVSFGDSTAWRIVHLGSVSLPAVDVGDPSTADVRLTIVDSDISGDDIDVDEVWLFNLSIGELTWVDCGDGTAAVGGPSKALFSEPPTVDVPTPRLLRGHSSDQSDAFNPGLDVTSWGRHVLADGDTKILTVTTNTTSAVTTLRVWPHWFITARQS